MLRMPLVAVVLSVLVLCANLARAADPAEVEELIRQGVELRRQKRDPAALPLFQKAYDLERSPRTAAQLATVESALGYWLAAERHLTEALASPHHPWLVQHLDQLTSWLQTVRSHIGEVEVTGEPEGAEVIVNGQSAGHLPLGKPVRVAEGAVQVQLRAPGYVESSVNANARGGGREAVSLRLERAPAPPPPPEHTDTAPPLTADPRAHADLGPEAGSGGGGGWLRPAAWVAASAAVAAAGVGVYGLIQQHKQQRQFDTYMPPGSMSRPCGTSAPARGGPPCDALYADAASSERLALIGFATAGGLASAALIAFLLSGSSDSHAARDFQVVVQPGRIALGWSARF
jgi:hypothetical protein